MPRRKRDITFTLALCLSLTVHAWLVHAAAWRYARDFSRFTLAGLAMPAMTLPPPPVQLPAPVIHRLGESEGLPQADALAFSPGETPLRAPQANQSQADFGLDPVGAGAGGEAAMPSRDSPAAAAGTPVFEPLPPSPPLRLPDSPPAELRVARPSAEPDSRDTTDPPNEAKPIDESRLIAIAEPVPIPSPPPPNPAERPDPLPDPTTPESPRPAPPVAPSVAGQSPSEPSVASNAADPSPQADSESDAFSTEASVDFASGRTVARVGRKHRLFRPKIEMAGHADLLQLPSPVTVVLELHLDATGNVERARIIKSSGSINIDQPTLIAAYRWWFEPSKDTNGRPKKDVIRFTCRFV